MTAIPFFPYRLVFQYLEPLSAIGGAFYSATYPRDYLSELTFPGSPVYVPPVTTQHQIAMLQLGNLFFLCGLNEFVILSSTSSTKVWKTVLFCLLLADIGHLASLAPLGTGVFWRCWEWNSMMWGGIGFVYVLAMLRVCFLLGFGLSLEGEKSAPSGTRASQSASKSTKEE